MRLRFLIPLGLGLAGCAGNCQTCRAWVVPSGQADDEAPRPPRVPRFEEEEELPELPAVPAPTPPGEDDPGPAPVKPRPVVKGGRVRHVSERTVEGQAIVIDGNTGAITIGSSGVPAVVQAPAFAAQPAAFPIVPGPVPDAVVFRLGQRLAKAAYVLATGECPPPRAQTAFMAVPVQGVQYVPVAMAAPAPVQYVQQAPAVQYVAAPQQAPAPAFAPAPQASPQQQAPRKGLFHFGR